jgi:DNA replication initiation complex subunit (GINS family)
MRKMEITLKDLENNIKTLPENFYEEVNDFIDFLKTKYSKSNAEDWSVNLSKTQKESIEKGFDDIENGRTVDYESASKRIQDHIASKR